MKFRVRKVKSKFKFVESPASKRASCKWKRYQLWILLNLWEKCLKFGENRRNIQKIYDSVRKELQDECHCASSLLKVARTCPIWQPEKMAEKLNRSSCLVMFCWFGIIAQAGRVEFTAVKPEGIKSIILVSCLSGTFFQVLNAICWTFDSQNTANDRPCKIWFHWKRSQSVAYSSRLILLYIECDFENFIAVIKCKNYLEKRLLPILLSSLELPRRGRLAY